jgi:hypothetical protein
VRLRDEWLWPCFAHLSFSIGRNVNVATSEVRNQCKAQIISLVMDAELRLQQ